MRSPRVRSPLVPEVLPPARPRWSAAAARRAPAPRPQVPEGCVRLVGCPHPLRLERVETLAPAGPTLLEMVARACDELRVPSALRGFGFAWIDGRPVRFEDWGGVRPAPGQTVAVRVLAGGGGGGGGGGKDATRALMTIAVMAAAMYFAPILASYALYGTAVAPGSLVAGVSFGCSVLTAGIGAAITGLGMAAINAMVPVRPPAGTSALESAASAAEDQVYSVSGMSNALDPWGEVPLALGFVRWAPKHGARPFTEIAGEDQYVRAVLDWGLGPLLVSDIRIGDTAITGYQDVEVQTAQGFEDDPAQNLYANDVYEDQFSALLEANAAVTRTTGVEADEFSVDITFPALVEYYSAGRNIVTVEIDAEYRLHGDSGAWTATGGFSVTECASQAVRRNLRVALPARGQYDVRLTRTTADSGSSNVQDDVYWTVLRTITAWPPITVDYANATTQLRVRATGQLSGTLDRLNGYTRTWCLDWDPEAETWVEGATNNPASLYRHVLQCDFNPFPRSDAQIDLEALAEWHEFCAAKGLAYNKVSYGQGVRELLAEIAAAGRATEAMLDGKWSVVIEREREDVEFDFTPALTWGVSVSRDLREAPHALRCPFLNQETWEDDEVVVYADGYSAESATIHEVVRFEGVTDPDQVWKLARYHLAVLHLRRETVTWNADFAHIAVSGRGSLVTLAHPTVGTGLAQGRVKAVAGGEAGALLVTLDEPCVMEEGSSYRCLFRKVSDATRGVRTVTTDPGSRTALTLPAQEGGIVPAPGDLYMFGLEGLETRSLLVTSIRPATAMSAQITGVDYAPAVYEADSGEIPEWTANVTRSPWLARTAPAVPAIVSLTSDESVMVRDAAGTLINRISVAYAPASGLVAAQAVQLQHRAPGGSWSPAITALAGEALLVSGVETGQTYGLRLRAVSAAGVASAWTAEVEHVVVGGVNPPPDVAGMFRQGNLVYWPYPNPPVDTTDEFRVRILAGMTRNWAKGADWPAESAITKGRSIDISDIGTGVQTIMVKARDVYGNLSENAAFLTVGLGEYAPDNLIITSNERTAGFPGAITNGSVNGSGDLVANDTGDAYLPDGNALYLPVAGALYLPVAYLAMGYTWTYRPAVTDVPGVAYLESSIAGDGWAIQYRRRGSLEQYLGNGDELYLPDSGALYLGGPTAWAPFPGGINVVREAVDFAVSTDSGSRQGKISVLSVNIDVADIEESFNNVVISAAGARLPITKTYRVIDYIGSITLREDGYGATGILVKDKNPTLGPLLAALGASQATIDVHKMKGH